MSDTRKNPRTSNISINKNENSIEISINPKIFPVPCIIRTVSNFTDKAYTFIDGDPSEKIVVKLVFKNKNLDLEKIGYEFNTELVSTFAQPRPLRMLERG